MSFLNFYVISSGIVLVQVVLLFNVVNLSQPCCFAKFFLHNFPFFYFLNASYSESRWAVDHSQPIFSVHRLLYRIRSACKTYIKMNCQKIFVFILCKTGFFFFYKCLTFIKTSKKLCTKN